MPIYQYCCEFGHLHEELQSIKDFDKNRIIDCPVCGNPLEMYFDSPPLGFVHGNITTLGQLGEKNFKDMGKIRSDEMMAKKKEEEGKVRAASGLMDKEEYRKARKLAGLTKEQKTRYIHTGKLPPGK